MLGAAPPDPPSTRPSLAARVLRTVGDAVSTQPPDADFLGRLTEEEDRVLDKHWPEAKPSGDGVDYFDQWMQIRAKRWRWRARIAIGGEIVWLLGKVAGVAIFFIAISERLSL
jgi:hypothetical protein